jgi:NADH-quinone oxidoreductase subunit H
MNLLLYFSIIKIIFKIILEILTLLIPILLAVAYLTLAERKILAIMQKRIGPNTVGFIGLLQPIADALKLLFKELLIPFKSDLFLYSLAPLITFIIALLSWSIIPINKNFILVNIDLSFLYLLMFSSLSIYGIILAGWSSNSRYAFLGALRSSAQIISYEVSIGLIILTIPICTNSLNFFDIIEFQETIWLIFPLFPSAIMFFISSLAETNRPPFDLPEAEGELVAGFNIEYSSAAFALFFIGEYTNIILMAFIFVNIFLGAWLCPFNYFYFLLIPDYIYYILKLLFIIFLFVWIRASVPRYRYDQLMNLGWKIFLPISLSWLIFIILIYFILLNII